MEETDIEANTIVTHEQKRKKNNKRHKKNSECDDIKSEMSLSEKRAARLERYRNHMAEVRLNETPEQHRARLDRARIRAAKVRKAETPEERFARLERARKYKNELRTNETPEQRTKRLESARRHMSEMRLHETPEQRANRLARTRMYNQVARMNETLEQRNARLASARRYMSEVRKNRTGQDHYIKVETQNPKSDPLDGEFHKQFDNNSLGYSSAEGGCEDLSAHQEIDLQHDGGYKTVNYQIHDKGNKDNLKDIMKILITKQYNNNDNDSADVICENIKKSNVNGTSTSLISEIMQPEKVLPMTYNVPAYDDIQLNSITSNILPLDEEVKWLLERQNKRDIEKEFPCPKCEKIYRYAHSLKKHLNVHDTIE